VVSATRTRGALCAALALLAACSSASTGGGDTVNPPAPCTFVNPLGAGQDPSIVRHDGSYYSVESRDDGVWVYRSDSLTALRRNGVRVWTAPSTGWNRDNVWAPELVLIDGRWYIYYAAGPTGGQGAAFVNQRSFVLESAGADPQGAYTDRGMLYTDDDGEMAVDNGWAIDLTVGRIDGQLYAVWSGWETNRTDTDRVPQHLYIAPMTNPWTVSGDRVLISSPTASWERGTQLDLQEGPEFLSNGDDVFIIYSARESWLPDYRLGLLRLTSPDADPLLPASWVKSSGPVFTGRPGVFGVGHATFTSSPDGTEPWIVYHTKSSSAPGWSDRVIHAQEFAWRADGTPDFGAPAGSGERLPMPSGQCR
jgi:GH43 family beta-xylosidase